ncbi:MAG TPA: hypothetical protein VII53_10970 [Solirubrobacteraceae bacterium]
MISLPGTDSPETDEIGYMPMPTPWAAAVAVMALLAFGVLVGSAVSPVAPSGAATPILVAVTPTATKAAKPLPVSQAPTSPPTTQAATPSPATTTEPVSTSTTTASTPSKPKGESKGLSTPSATAQLPPIKHVFLIVLSDQGATAFSPGSPAPYLAKTLPHAGELLENYFAVSNGELANAIALTSGQGPTTQTVADCPLYIDVTPAAAGAEGQVLGSGCVYPRPTLTLGDQLTRAGKSWKAYVEGIEMGGPGQPASCRHPTLGATGVENAPSPAPSPQDAYVTWRNPFVYFHSLIDSPQCAKDDIGLGRLASDLKKASTTPSLAYIVPDRCHDGSEAPCAPGQPAGLPATEAFLRKVVPEIKASAAYNQGGLIAITFDQAPQSGPAADSSGCCMTAPYPNLPTPPATPTTTPAPTTASPTAPPNSAAAPSTTTPSTAPSSTTPSTTASPTSPSTSGTGSTGVSGAQTATPTGGGRVGLLLISKYVKPGSLNVTGEYNHFALLRSIENLFGLKPLGYAAAPGLLAFDSSVFNAYK